MILKQIALCWIVVAEAHLFLAIRPVIHTVYDLTHWINAHQPGIKRPEQTSYFGWIGYTRIEPQIIVVLLNDDRYPVVNVFE